jgi:ubiquinone biosynthesis protein UbiJ
MATQSPFSFLDSIFDRLAAGPQPPQWLVHEVHQRMVLFINHVLMQEPEAMDRLAASEAAWRACSGAPIPWRLLVTPAGLFNVAPEGAAPDCSLHVTEASPLALASVALRGDKPAIRIEGDVQLAAEINWLVDHVRWDLEEDLARLMGDAPAHTLAQVARKAAQALRQFVGTRGVCIAPAPAACGTRCARGTSNADRTAA